MAYKNLVLIRNGSIDDETESIPLHQLKHSDSRLFMHNPLFPPRDSSENPQLVWVLTGDKAGDRSQLMGLAEALGRPFEEKRLQFNKRYKKSNLRLAHSLQSLDIARSAALQPPWPDLVLASGRRAVPVARWIKRQTKGHAKLVHIGRPWAPLSLFDLVVSTAQYQLPARPNVVTNVFTLNRIDPERLASAKARWGPVFSAYSRPLIGVLVGGATRPFLFDSAAASALGQAAGDMARSLGGTLLVSTSPRTGKDATEALFANLPDSAFRQSFQAEGHNPYLGIIGLADRFIVTGDSASMLSEACLSGKPVHVFPMPERPDLRMRLSRKMRTICLGSDGNAGGALAKAYELLIASGITAQATRDMRLFHQALEKGGWIRSLTDLSSPPMLRPRDELALTVNRVRALYY